MLVLLCLCAFLPGIAELPPIDRDESRFMQASKQMVESGDLVDIRFQDESRYKKPVGIYWLQMPRWRFAAGAPRRRSGSIAWSRCSAGIDRRVRDLRNRPQAVRRSRRADRGDCAGRHLRAAFEARIAKTDAMLLATAVLAQGRWPALPRRP